MANGKGGGNRVVKGNNDSRPNGKAFKKNPKTPRKTGRTIGGYSLERLAVKERRRQAYAAGFKEVGR